MLSTLCTTLLLAFATSDHGETTRWLAKLESNVAAERGAAQRWLAANLEPADFELLHEAAASGGAESQRRLVSVLASSERHFGLAALLGTDEREGVAQVGREALLELASTWSTASEERGARRSKLILQLKERAFARFSFDPREHELKDVLELITIAGDSGVMLVLDPDLMQSRSELKLDPRTDALLSGNQAELLSTLGRSYSFGIDGFGLDDQGDMAWVRVCRRLRAGKSSGRELLVDWALRVASDEQPQDARFCARALASSGWPAAIAWLETRWFDRADEAALSGLRLLASRGFVAPRLRSAAVQAAWLEPARAREALEETARAVGALGRQGVNGADLELGLLAGEHEFTASQLWLRLVALEQRGSETSAARDFVLAILRAPDARPALAYQALRTAAELELELGDSLTTELVLSLLQFGVNVDGGRELTGLFLRTGVEPVRVPNIQDWNREQRLVLCEWFFLSQKPESVAVAGELLKRLSEDYEVAPSPSINELTARLREWQRAGRGDELRDWLAGITPQSGATRSLLLHLGLLDSGTSESLAEMFMAVIEKQEPPGPDLVSLAALAAGPKSDEILDLLARLARDTPPSPAGLAKSAPRLNRALDEAVRVLRAERLDSQLAGFADQIQSAGWPASWPAAPEPEALPLRLFERRFEP